MGCSNYSKTPKIPSYGIRKIDNDIILDNKNIVCSKLFSPNKNFERDPALMSESTVLFGNFSKLNPSNQLKGTGQYINQGTVEPLYEISSSHKVMKRKSSSSYCESDAPESINCYFYGVNSEKIASIIFNLFVTHELVRECQNEKCIKEKGNNSKIACYLGSSNEWTSTSSSNKTSVKY